MIFNKQYKLTTSLTQSAARKKLIGKHIDLHGLNFEILEKDRLLKIVPHDELEEKLRILPVTYIELNEQNGNTNATLYIKPRQIDVGGPYLMIFFCCFLILAGIGFYVLKGELFIYPAISLIAVGSIAFLIFWIRMQSGYFDYVKKIKQFVESKIK